MTWEEELLTLFDLPVFEQVRPPVPGATAHDRMVQSLEEVNSFYEKYGRKPEMKAPDLQEKALAHTLIGIRKNKKKSTDLLRYDRFNLLQDAPSVCQEEEITSGYLSMDDELTALFDNPILTITDEELALFDVPDELKKTLDKREPEYVAQREVCADFNLYENGFKLVHRELKAGKRSLQKFKTQSLQEGHYYFTGGVLVFLEKIFSLRKEKNGTLNGRTRSIYENGTESNILLDSLRKSIYSDGFIVTDSTDTDESSFQQKFAITKDDIQDGWIYVVRSRSEEPSIKSLRNLYKIGFSTIPVEIRVGNAKNEPTYLMDEVEIIAVWKTFNMKTHQFENLIHQFFSTVQYQVKVKDSAGNLFTPREWYVVPLSIINTVIEKIIDRTIVNYHYNPQLQVLEEAELKKERLKSEKTDTTGWSILTLNIKKNWFDKILSGEKNIEYRDLKSSKLNTYTWIDNEDGKRYLRQFDAIRFYVGYHRDQDSALVEVLATEYNSDSRQVEYHLGKVLEVL